MWIQRRERHRPDLLCGSAKLSWSSDGPCVGPRRSGATHNSSVRPDDDTRNKLGRKSRGIAAVSGVDAGSPAAEAHIELGDLLLTFDGETAHSVNDLAQRIAGTSPGQTVTLEVLRGGKPLTLNV